MSEVLARPARPEGSTIHTIVAVTFVSAPTTEALREALSLHDRMRGRYPRRQELRAATGRPSTPEQWQLGWTVAKSPDSAFDYSKPDGSVKQAMGLHRQRRVHPAYGLSRTPLRFNARFWKSTSSCSRY